MMVTSLTICEVRSMLPFWVVRGNGFMSSPGWYFGKRLRNPFPVLTCVGRARLEAFSDNSGKLQLSLQEIIEWLTAKDEELSEQLPIGGDVGAVQHQREFHQVKCTVIPF